MTEELNLGDQVRAYGYSASGTWFDGERGEIIGLTQKVATVSFKGRCWQFHNHQLEPIQPKLALMRFWVNVYPDGPKWEYRYQCLGDAERSRGATCLGTLVC